MQTASRADRLTGDNLKCDCRSFRTRCPTEYKDRFKGARKKTVYSRNLYIFLSDQKTARDPLEINHFCGSLSFPMPSFVV